MRRKKPILLDTDGILTVGFFKKCADRINDEHGTSFTIDDFTTDLRVVMKEYWNADCEAWVRSEGFCRDFDVEPGAQQFVKTLYDMGFNVVHVTSPYRDAPTWGHDRIKWLGEHFEATRDDVVLCHDKRFVDGLTLVEDLPKNANDWAYHDFKRDRPYLFSRPWNLNDQKDLLKSFYTVVDSYDRLIQEFDGNQQDQRYGFSDTRDWKTKPETVKIKDLHKED